MEIIGLDLHKRESQLSIKADDGTITDRRIATSRERFTAVFGARPRARSLLEASTESDWVARHLESLGHEVIVADPSYAPMFANRSRRSKTDKRDARTLTNAGPDERECVGAETDRRAREMPWRTPDARSARIVCELLPQKLALCSHVSTRDRTGRRSSATRRRGARPRPEPDGLRWCRRPRAAGQVEGGA